MNWYNTCRLFGMRAFFVFYRTLALPLIGISLVCAHQVWQAQTGFFVFRVLWVKFLTSIVIATYIAIFQSGQFIFYNNLGYSRWRLLLSVFGFDFVIWVLLMIATVQVL